MKLLLSFVFVSISFFDLKAQDAIPKMELKHNGFVGSDSTKNFIVINIANKKKNELYKSCLVYLNTIYRNPQKVLSVVENESITINGLTESIKGRLDWYKYQIYYSINIQFKDGKLRFEPSITDMTEIWSENKERKFYVANTDSPNKVEINCIWMKDKNNNNYFVLDKSIKLSIEGWMNDYISSLLGGISKNDW